METLEKKNCVFYIDEDRIYHNDMREGAMLSAEDIDDFLTAFDELCGEKKFVVLTDLRKIKSVDKAFRDAMGHNRNSKYVGAVALLVASPVSRIVAQFFLSINKPFYPMKVFSNEKQAIHWLKERQSEQNL